MTVRTVLDTVLFFIHYPSLFYIFLFIYNNFTEILLVVYKYKKEKSTNRENFSKGVDLAIATTFILGREIGASGGR